MSNTGASDTKTLDEDTAVSAALTVAKGVEQKIHINTTAKRSRTLCQRWITISLVV